MSAGSRDSRRRVCVCLPLPHINGMIFFYFIFFYTKRKEEKENHPHFNLAWANLQSMEIHVHSQDWHVCNSQCSVYTRSHAVNSLSQGTWCHLQKEEIPASWRNRRRRTDENHRETLKLLNPQQLALFFLDPNCQGIKHYLFLF